MLCARKRSHCVVHCHVQPPRLVGLCLPAQLCSFPSQSLSFSSLTNKGQTFHYTTWLCCCVWCIHKHITVSSYSSPAEPQTCPKPHPQILKGSITDERTHCAPKTEQHEVKQCCCMGGAEKRRRLHWRLAVCAAMRLVTAYVQVVYANQRIITVKVQIISQITLSIISYRSKCGLLSQSHACERVLFTLVGPTARRFIYQYSAFNGASTALLDTHRHTQWICSPWWQ